MKTRETPHHRTGLRAPAVPVAKNARTLLFVVNDPSFFVSHRLPIALAARAAGFDVHVATAPGSGTDRILETGLHWYPIPLSRSGWEPWRELASVIYIYRILRRIKPDVLHLVTIKPVLYGGLVGRLVGIPAVVMAVSGLGYVFLASGIRAVLRRAVIARLYRLAFKQRRLRVIFQNPADRQALCALTSLASAQTVLIRGSGVDLSRFVAPGPRTDRVVVVMAARLLRDKGVYEYVSAARTLKARNVVVECWLAGDIDPGNPTSVSRAELEQWKQEGCVKVLGFQADIAALFGIASIVVLPSYREGLPKVLLEASASGCAIVTTDVPGCRDAVEDGQTGLLVAPRDPVALANAIEQLVRDRDLCERIGRAGREYAHAHFSVERVIASHLALYRELCT